MIPEEYESHTMKKKSELTLLASQFRHGFEEYVVEERPEIYSKFPVGCCGDVSILLGTYLKDCGMGSFNYVCGELPLDEKTGLGQSHAWISQEDVIIDITADQFDGVREKVTVTENQEWHKKFANKIDGEADFNKYDKRTKARLQKIYDNIIGRITGKP